MDLPYSSSSSSPLPHAAAQTAARLAEAREANRAAGPDPLDARDAGLALLTLTGMLHAFDSVLYTSEGFCDVRVRPRGGGFPRRGMARAGDVADDGFDDGFGDDDFFDDGRCWSSAAATSPAAGSAALATPAEPGAAAGGGKDSATLGRGRRRPDLMAARAVSAMLAVPEDGAGRCDDVA